MKDSPYRILLADSDALKQKAFELREEVFVVEQRVDKRDEFDEFEDISRHFVALDQAGKSVGASRWRVTEKGIKLERFAVKATARGKGLGQQLVQVTLEDVKTQKGTGNYIYLHAQLAAVTLYERFGFQKVGDQFDECDIMHYKMELIN